MAYFEKNDGSFRVTFDTDITTRRHDVRLELGSYGKKIIPENNSCELYFEEKDIEAFAAKLEKLYPSIQYVNKLMTHSWGQKVIRFYDLDGNLIEVGTPM